MFTFTSTANVLAVKNEIRSAALIHLLALFIVSFAFFCCKIDNFTLHGYSILVKLHLRRCFLGITAISILFQYEAKCVFIARCLTIGKSFPFKLFQLFRMCYPVFQDETGHFAPTHLGVDNYRARFPVFQGIELGRNDLYFPTDFFPVEQVFHFTTRLTRMPPCCRMASMK